MDLVLEVCDGYFFDKLYQTAPFSHPVLAPFFAQRDTISRQSVSLYIFTTISGLLLYFSFAALNYIAFYDKAQEKHPKFLKNQIRREIFLSVWSIPIMSLFTLPWWVGEVRGYSKLYPNWGDYSTAYGLFSVVFFLAFTDMLIYWIHRWLHHPLLYKNIHKPHHTWKLCTPFASHAFHPVDGYLQSLPYHIFVFLFPLHRFLYLGLFVFVNFWTISIHDGNAFNLPGFINGAAHHTLHHLEYRYNYGQYFTLWDKIGGSYKKPVFGAKDLGADPRAKED